MKAGPEEEEVEEWYHSLRWSNLIKWPTTDWRYWIPRILHIESGQDQAVPGLLEQG
jgi:hypothetical protein